MTTLEQAPTGACGQHADAAATVREPRACPHGGQHEHGTRSCYVLDECRCPPCTCANTEYQSERNRLIAAGRWAPLVDGGPVAAHIEALVRAGLRRKQIADLAGVSFSVVSKVVAGDGLRRVRAETARALLGVPRPVVDGTGTRRRLQALVAIGWPPPALDHELGLQAGCVEQLLQAAEVSDTTAGRVGRLFERLWDRPPPQVSEADKRAADEALARAKRNGWGPPMAWDHELNPIDDPAAEPDLGAKVRTYKIPPADELLFLLEGGETVESLARRFGVKTDSINQALRRARRAQEQAEPAESSETVGEAAA